jgi:LPS sulfotransferase NodH
MADSRSYLLCGTPRTGSTLLCSLLASTGVLGRPESYFRGPDEPAWAARFGLAVRGGRARDYHAFVEAVREAGTTGNGVFGARVMWGSLERVVEGLGQAPGQPDRDVLEGAFGPLTFIHLRREDVAAQAVSWSRAEQTGYWQSGDVARHEPREDLAQMQWLHATIRRHNAAWQAWFDAQGVEPHRLTYEGLVSDPHEAVVAFAARLGVELPGDWRARSPHRRQADELNRAWTDALRKSL